MARLHSSRDSNEIELVTGERSSRLVIAPKASGFGSSASGAELLMLALAACYCNDIYRESARMGIEVTNVEVECSADFPAEGQPASGIEYSTRITAKAPDAHIRELAAVTDRLAEIHGTVRAATPVVLLRVDADPC